MILDIVLHPDNRLRKKSLDVDKDKIFNLNKLIQDMTETMLKKDGIGLAAPQIGENIRLVVINKDMAGTDDHLVMINPEITFYSKKNIIIEEGCLSVPNIFEEVERPDKIRVKAINQKGEKIKFKAKDMLARVIQHEIDHLDGILFIDKIAK